MFINVIPLKHMRNIAVHCPTEETAVAFVKAIHKEFPDHYFRGHVPNDAHFSNYKEETCYAPYLDEPCGSMTYCSLEYYEECGRRIISVFDLIGSEDLGEVNPSDVDIKSLFGME